MISQKNIDSLTGLRIFAALFVVIFHVRNAYFYDAPHYIKSLMTLGFIGVNIFFILSGFILGYQYFDRVISMKDFFIARFARIYPVYILGLLLTAGYIAPGVKYLPQIMMSNILLMQAWTPSSACVWNCQGWSLSAETFFYALFPITMLIIRMKGKRLLWGWGVIYGVILIIPVGLIVSGKYNQLSETALNTIQYTPLLRLPEFVLGILTAMIFKEGSLNLSRNASTIMFITIIAALIAIPKEFGVILIGGAFDILFVFLILSLATDGDRLGTFLGTKWLCLLGESSYVLYILHVFIFNIVRAGNVNYLKVGRFAEGMIFLVVLLSASVIIYIYYEKPMRNYIRNRFGIKNDTSAASL